MPEPTDRPTYGSRNSIVFMWQISCWHVCATYWFCQREFALSCGNILWIFASRTVEHNPVSHARVASTILCEHIIFNAKPTVNSTILVRYLWLWYRNYDFGVQRVLSSDENEATVSSTSVRRQPYRRRSAAGYIYCNRWLDLEYSVGNDFHTTYLYVYLTCACLEIMTFVTI
jgi:hypothetical protein